MSAITAKVSSAGQITLPVSIRRALGLDIGDEVELQENNGRVTLRRAETDEEKIKRVFKEIDEINAKYRANMTPEQKELAEMTKGWTVRQFHEYFDNLPEHKAYIKEKYGV